jgi:hypothetical protein
MRGFRGFAGFAAAMVAVIGGITWLSIALFGARIGPEGVRAIVTSAGVAFTVQLLTFGIAKAIAPMNVMAGWAGGAIVRLVVLALHGLFGAALSLATFFFLTMMMEPFFLAPSASKAPSSAQ